MNKKLVVNANSFETRIGLLEEESLTEFYNEIAGSRGMVGNIYKGKVDKVLPGMQSAFVDIGLDKDAFLYVSDIFEHSSSFEKFFMEEEDDGYDLQSEIEASRGNHSYSIDDLLKEGQEILVQVSKEPISGKGARITAHVTLPGRFLVYMPTIRHIGVSRRIENEEERNRLREIVTGFENSSGGLIVRTAGEGRSSEEFLRDYRYLRKLWADILRRSEIVSAPTLIHRELGLLNRVLRDVVTEEFTAIIIDSESEYQNCLEFLNRIQPELVSRVKLRTKDAPVFDEFGIETELEKSLRSRVWLKSGGYIVINQTEALVAIDVNTGKFVGKKRLEDTVVKTNLEAVKEIVRQIRLRNLGGIIVVDFIDMEEQENRDRVMVCLEDEIKRDRSKTKILQISDFGLIEITRKRTRQSLERRLCLVCPYCDGLGRIKSVQTICHAIHREILKMGRSIRGSKVTVRANPEVAEALLTTEYRIIRDLEDSVAIEVEIVKDHSIHHEHYDIVVG